MAETWAQARAVYGPGGVVRDVMTGLYAEQDITMLAAYPVYFGGIALNVENPAPASTEPNGIKVRVPGIKSFQLTGEALGYIPSPIPFSEAFTAVQTGVVDGVMAAGLVIWLEPDPFLGGEAMISTGHLFAISLLLGAWIESPMV